MNTLVVGVDSDIGLALYKSIPNCIATSRKIKEHIYLDLEDKSSWPKFDSLDLVYYCIGVNGRDNSPEKVINVNGILSYEFLEHLTQFLSDGATVYVLTSLVSSMTVNAKTEIKSNVYYKMSKSVLNMGVIDLHHRYKNINWILVHPGFVKTKMTAGLNIQTAISPEQSSKNILAIPKYKGLKFLNANGNIIEW
jgi:NAD(P)-dependent dehydrogenase (short-subunit alcohol dehydrogenase family)